MIRKLLVLLAAGAAAGAVLRSRRQAPVEPQAVVPQPPPTAAPFRTVPSSGDVESEDHAGSWADDGGNGVGGGQRPAQSAPTHRS